MRPIAYPSGIRRTNLAGPACRERFVPLDTPFAAPLRDFGVLQAGVAELHPPFDQGYPDPRHHLLIHTFAGAGAALVGGRAVDLVAEATWLIPAGCPYRYVVAAAPWSIMWFHLADDRRFAYLRRLPPQPVFRGFPQRFAPMLEILIAESVSPVPGALRLAQLCAEAVTIYLRRRLDNATGEDAEAALLETVWRQVGADLARPWTAQAIAAAAGLGANHLGQLMRRVTGRTTMAYLAQLRCTAARSLLTREGATLAEVAPRVGYASAFALSKAYKRVTGRAPRRE